MPAITDLNTNNIETKIIIITGASSGVGFEAALELSAAGHIVIAIARSKEKLQQLQELSLKLNPQAQIITVVFDITSGDYNSLKTALKSRFSKIDILINNAGLLVNRNFQELSLNDFEEMMQANFFGHVKMIQAVLPFMPAKSHIVNIGSMGGYQGSDKFAGLAAYSASKAALHNLTECLAKELLFEKVSINCLALGSAQTEMLEKAFPGYESPVMAFEMGQYIADFALNGNKFFNGKIIPVAQNNP